MNNELNDAIRSAKVKAIRMALWRRHNRIALIIDRGSYNPDGSRRVPYVGLANHLRNAIADFPK
jgi:hypothetical protein